MEALSDREKIELLKNNLTPEQQAELLQGNEQWEPPIPFATLATPDFPINCLPDPVAKFVEALAESTQTPPEMAGVLSLGILATAFQSRYEVEITPDWREPLCLYSVAVASPGERKTSVIGALTKPVYDYEYARRELEKEEVAQNQQKKRILESAIKNAEKNAAIDKAKRDKPIEDWDSVINKDYDWHSEKLKKLREEMLIFQDKHPYRLLVDDVTPEKIVDIMDMQNGCITVASAEGGIFDSLKGRYDKNASFDIYLKGHAGDPVSVDRISRKTNYIKQPRITMMLAVQPDVLKGLMGNATLKGRGLCGRFLYVICNSKMGRRNVNPNTILQHTKENYHSFIKRILSGRDTGTIYLSEEAHRAKLDYMAKVESRLGLGGEWEFIKDWGGKVVGVMLRIAALIHAAESKENPDKKPINAETIERAVKIAEALGVHAMAAYQTMGADEGQEDAKYLWRRIEDAGQAEISKRDLFDICKGKFKKVEAMDPALKTLIEMGYIRAEDIKTGGRPTNKIIVNPMSNIRKSSKTFSV